MRADQGDSWDGDGDLMGKLRIFRVLVWENLGLRSWHNDGNWWEFLGFETHFGIWGWV